MAQMEYILILAATLVLFFVEAQQDGQQVPLDRSGQDYIPAQGGGGGGTGQDQGMGGGGTGQDWGQGGGGTGQDWGQGGGGTGQNQGQYNSNLGNRGFNPNQVPNSDYCSYSRSQPSDAYFVGYKSGSTQFSASGACKCKIRATVATYITMDTYLDDPNYESRSSVEINNERPACGPLMFFDTTGTDYYICPAYMSYQQTTHRTEHALKARDEMTFEIYNPKKQTIQNFVKISSSSPYMTISCQQNDAQSILVCPCRGIKSGGKLGNYTKAVADRVGLIVGLVILCILFVVAIVLVVIFVKKHRQSGKESV